MAKVTFWMRKYSRVPIEKTTAKKIRRIVPATKIHHLRVKSSP